MVHQSTTNKPYVKGQVPVIRAWSGISHSDQYRDEAAVVSRGHRMK